MGFIDRVGNETRINTAVIQERVALGWRPITVDLLPGAVKSFSSSNNAGDFAQRRPQIVRTRQIDPARQSSPSAKSKPSLCPAVVFWVRQYGSEPPWTENDRRGQPTGLLREQAQQRITEK